MERDVRKMQQEERFGSGPWTLPRVRPAINSAVRCEPTIDSVFERCVAEAFLAMSAPLQAAPWAIHQARLNSRRALRPACFRNRGFNNDRSLADRPLWRACYPLRHLGDPLRSLR